MKGFLLVLFSLNVYASSFESGLAHTCVNNANFLKIKGEDGVMNYCKTCLADMNLPLGTKPIDRLCSDAIIQYNAYQNNNQAKQ